MDFSVRKTYLNNEYIKLAPKEFDLLEYLVINKGLSLSRDKLLEFVWGYDFEGGSRVVDNHIKKLRHKLGKYGQCIETVVYLSEIRDQGEIIYCISLITLENIEDTFDVLGGYYFYKMDFKTNDEL